MELFFFRDSNGRVPLIDWLDELTPKVQQKCLVRLDRLAELGPQLRRPEADYLREGIYELRVGFQGIHYRILYFFEGKDVVIVTHGLIKEDVVPPREIDLAIRRRDVYRTNPQQHRFRPKDEP